MTEPLTEDYLTEFAREQQRHVFSPHLTIGDRCPACSHPFHGLPCTAPTGHGLCSCPSACEVAS